MIEAAAEPVELLALRRQAWVRGQRRRLAEGGTYPTEAEFPDVVHHELAELLALARLTPDDPDAALTRWYEGAEAWPTASSWPFTRAVLARDIADHGWRKEQDRSCPALEPYQAELSAEIARLEPLTNWCRQLVSGPGRTE
jgi:hypothetical protein